MRHGPGPLGGDGSKQGDRVAPRLVGRPALDGGVEGGAQGPDVGCRVGVLAAGQLGREVARGPCHEADRGELVVAVPTGDPEVADLGASGLVDEHVGGLDVPVDDAALMGTGQGAGQLGADVGDPPRRELPVTRDLVGQGLALDVLHDQPGPRVVVDHVVDGDGVGVVERGGRAGLAHGAFGLGRRLAGQGAHLLDRDLTTEDLVAAQPHGAHAAAADRA